MSLRGTAHSESPLLDASRMAWSGNQYHIQSDCMQVSTDDTSDRASPINNIPQCGPSSTTILRVLQSDMVTR